jgi:hypothetical protein
MILNFRLGNRITAVSLIQEDGHWVPDSELALPAGPLCPDIGQYSYTPPDLSFNFQSSSKWYGVAVPVGFPVLDFVLVNFDPTIKQCVIYLIQIARASDPFSSHFTNTTCSAESKERIRVLTETIYRTFDPTSSAVNREVKFVMYAPYTDTASGKHAAPNQTESYYFSPAERIPVSGTARPKTKKPKLNPSAAGLCCRCGSGPCRSCCCGANHTACVNCNSSGCQNKASDPAVNSSSS